MMRRTDGSWTISIRWPGVETTMRPSPHCRVQTAGNVTGRLHASKSRFACVVVARTSLYSSESTQYCSVVRSKSSMPSVIGWLRPSSVISTV